MPSAFLRVAVFVHTCMMLLCGTAWASRPTQCQTEWLSRSDRTFKAAELSAACANPALLKSAEMLLCTDKKTQAEYVGLVDKVCPNKLNIDKVPKADLLGFFQRYMANGNPAEAVDDTVTATADPAPVIVVQTQGAKAEGFGGPAVGVVAQGVADFLVKRAEAEVSLFATTEFFNKVCSDDAVLTLPMRDGVKKEVKPKDLFPTTCLLLDGDDEPPSLGTMRAAILQDFQALPKQIVEAVVARSSILLGCSLDIGYALASGMRAGIDPWTLLLTTHIELVDAKPDAGSSRGLPHYATSLKLCWDTWRYVEQAAHELEKFRQEGGNGAYIKVTQGKALEAIQLDSGLSPELVSALAEAFAAISASSATPSEASTQRVIAATFRVVAQALTDERCAAPKTDKADCAKKIDQAREVSVALAQGKWSAAATAFLTADKLHEALFAKAPKMKALVAAAAAIADAKDSDGVKAALEQFAAPVGSWRQKHDSCGIGIVGLVGMNLSNENVIGSKNWGATVQPTLAAGFDFYIPLGSERIGLQFPVIDVGNIASVRFNQDGSDVAKAETTPDPALAQLFAPGAYAFASIGRSPFTVGGGCSWIPSLRKVNVSGSVDDHAVVRCGATLAVDITIMPLVQF